MKHIFLASITFFLFVVTTAPAVANERYSPWRVRSIDTMKLSRDLAKQSVEGEDFSNVIDKQVSLIADTGATHVAVGTPYDAEFIPYLSRWVAAARKYKLNVWFRGNFSGWEGWFNYARMTPKQHTDNIDAFIRENAELFEDGDIFTTCPECENGGPGDPRQTRFIQGHRDFLIDESRRARTAFTSIQKDVETNYFSMNGDVAKLIMDQETTQALGGIVVLDHYVKTPRELREDIEAIQKQSRGRIVLGEFGAPIPDIHGPMTPDEQASWLTEALKEISTLDTVIGLNYWAGTNSSTALWEKGATPKPAVQVLTDFYNGEYLKGSVVTKRGLPIKNASVQFGDIIITADDNGRFFLPYLPKNTELTVTAPGYEEKVTRFQDRRRQMAIALNKVGEGSGSFRFIFSWDEIKQFFLALFI